MVSVIKNCRVTNSDAKVLRGWCVTPQSIHTGIDLQGTEVYSLKRGTVIQIGKDSDGYVITVEYSHKRSYRYMNLSKVLVNLGEYIGEGELIGECKDFVHFEHVLTSKQTPVLPVRIGSVTYYKVDPYPELVAEVE